MIHACTVLYAARQSAGSPSSLGSKHQRCSDCGFRVADRGLFWSWPWRLFRVLLVMIEVGSRASPAGCLTPASVQCSSTRELFREVLPDGVACSN